MTEQTERAYRAYREAADKGYGDSNRPITPARMNAIDTRIRRLQQRYEQLLCAEQGKPWFPR